MDCHPTSVDCLAALAVHDVGMRILLRVLFCSGLMATTLLAGPEDDKSVDKTGEAARYPALQQVTGPLAEANNEIEKLRKQLKNLKSGEERDRLEERLKEERKLVADLRQNFLNTVGGVEAAEYNGSGNEGMSMQEQLIDVFQPLLNMLREMTSSPRELDSLRNSLAQWEERKHKAEVVLERIKEYEALNQNKELLPEYESARRLWEGRQSKSVSEIGVLKRQIQEREQKRKPFWEVLSDLFSDFFRSRGLNLLLALVTGVLSFLLVRRIYIKLRPYSPVHRRGRVSLATRMADIMAMVLAVGAALWGVLMVFYLRGDWLLLSLVVLLLFGAAWAGKTSIPPYIEQIRTMLNLGSIE